MKKYLLFLLFFTVLLLSTSCDDNSTEADETAPEVVISNPVNNAEFTSGQIIRIIAEATDNKGIEKVEFKINGELEYEDEEEPYQYEWDTSGLYDNQSLQAKAFDTSGNTGLSDVNNVTIINNEPPYPPNDPNPSENAENVAISSDLSWSGSDPDGDAFTYDVYWGTDPSPDNGELVSEDQNATSFNPGTMQYETTYYWKIIASDGEYETEGDVWSYTTSEESNYGDMIFVEGGSFEMGDHFDEAYSDELPVHSVTLNSFYIGQYEVTHTKYIEFLNSYGVSPDGSYNGTELIDMNDSDCAVDYNGSFYFSGSSDAPEADCPIKKVTWYGGLVYCNWLSEHEGLSPCYNLSDWSCDFSADGYRLPTEAEWEYASRGGINWEDNYRYSGTTDNLGDYAWYGQGLSGLTHAVGTKLPNQLGIYDMSGNVYEWCNDRWEYYYYEFSPEDNPTGPDIGSSRVVRGGWWGDFASNCRVAHRNGIRQFTSSGGTGFRLCRAIE